MPKLAYIGDPGNEETIPLSQVPDLPIIGRGSRGRRVAPSTIYRWASRGCRGVQLEVIRVGGVLKTTPSAVRRFANRLSGIPIPTNTVTKKSRLAQRVREELDRARI